VVIKFIPYAPHTDEAYSHQVYGTVKLRVEFKDDGTIGEIETVEGMPYGLTEEAREAAKGILFTPATIDGTPVTSRKVVEFDFMAHRAN
jgi:outer membrane biosynthesis protein TonB